MVKQKQTGYGGASGKQHNEFARKQRRSQPTDGFISSHMRRARHAKRCRFDICPEKQKYQCILNSVSSDTLVPCNGTH